MTLPVHPLAELIPPMSGEEFSELCEDIHKNGQREAVTLYEGKVLDGRHRDRACSDLGIEPTTREYDGDEPAAYVLSLNVKRRNLTPSQRAAIAVEFLPELEEEAKKRQGEHLRSAPRDHLGHAKSGSLEPDLGKTHRAREDAGALVGVSGATVDRARRVKERAPDDFERVKSGETTVRAADNKLRETPTEPGTDAIGRSQPRAYFGKGDKWQESTEPLTRYLTAWGKRGYDFSHVNPREASNRLKRIDSLIAGLEATRADLEPRTQKAKLTL